MSHRLPKILIGTWGMVDWSRDDLLTPEQLLRSAFFAGYEWYDTAPVYGSGAAEIALSTLPKSAKIATKVHARNRSQDIQTAYDSVWVTQVVNKSLARLDREKIDLLQLHNWSYHWSELGDSVETFESLIKSGKVRAIGISLPIDPPDDLDIAVDKLLSVANTFQIHYNVYHQQNALLIKKLIDRNASVMLRSVLLHGALIRTEGHLGPCHPANEYSMIEGIKQISQTTNPLEYLLKHAFATGAQSVIVGISRVQHIEALEAIHLC
jgi:aryl-alcohol dehydrogenase-like predicted oxidoreductase